MVIDRFFTPTFFMWAFCYNKKEKNLMQQVSYMGNGYTTEFTFNFPYFENTNIIVTKNGTSTTGYTIVGTSAGIDADIPYTGGKIVFDNAPISTDSITISRNLPLIRIADYQPTAKINPTTLNQDINYTIEILKDFKDDLDTFNILYSELTNQTSIQILTTKIDTVSTQITNLGDISTLRQSVTTNSNDITTLKGYDYVVESQTPTANNNYTWYRKYKSGWVEQGGIDTTSYITFPVTMADTHYTVNCGMEIPDSNIGNPTVSYMDKSTTGIRILLRWDGAGTTGERCWQVSGFAAA